MRMIQPRMSRLGRAAMVVGPATAGVLSILSLLAPPAAFAHRDPTIAVVLTGVTPKLPEGVVLELLDSEMTYAALRNDAEEPVYALDRERKPFLQVSADGVYGDLDSPYLQSAPGQITQDSTVKLDCCPDGRWARLSTKPAWVWPDPRLDPPLRTPTTNDDRGLGGMPSDEPLAHWDFDLRYDDTRYTAKGVVERRQVGEVTTKIEHAPDGISASVIESRPPQIRIQVSKGTNVEVLDADGASFIQISPRGAYGRVASASYQAHLRATGLSTPESGAWQPIAGGGPGKATWADLRLDYQANMPDDAGQAQAASVDKWSIPVLVNGERSEISGVSRWKPATPPPLPSEEGSTGFWAAGGTASYLVAGGLTIAVLGAYALSRARRKEPT
ncbi:hypothetical protein [Nocardioides sp. NPDC006303]|uniref:hypothetical protein n=1 Tax=Nocardioides sp. NPDC006303 TaxID=3156747 RepID=UPI0033A0592F